MYYEDHLAVAGKDISSRNFCKLVEEAVFLFEEEKCFRLLTQKGKSKCNTKEEEESDKRIFSLFPRKKRTLEKRYVNGASTSSSLLPDLNKISTDSVTGEALQWSSSPSSSSFLGDYRKILADSETQNPCSSVPCSSSLLVKKAKVDPFSNPNSQSSSSSSSLSSCLTQNSSRKKRSVEQPRKGGSGTSKIVYLSYKGRQMPESLLRVMRDMNVAEESKLIFERMKLFKTDVAPGESRLSMPFNQLIRNNFLTPVEARIIQEDFNNDEKTGVGALLVNQRCEKWGVMLKRWETTGSWNYCLTCGWNDVVKGNGLKVDDGISIWSFRFRGLLCFALIPLLTKEQSSSSLAQCL